MSEKKHVVSLDFDGVLFPRSPIQAEALMKWMFAPWRYNRPFEPEYSPITIADRAMHNVPLSKKEAFDLNRHEKRHVKPNIKQFLNALGVEIIVGNTGRSNNKPWIDMTKAYLDEAGIYDYFTCIYFKPKGVSSDESKYWALKEIDAKGCEFTHYDDNAYTVKQLAPLFPNSHFIIVQDLTTGILFSRAEMERYHNVKRIAMTRSGLVVATY